MKPVYKKYSSKNNRKNHSGNRNRRKKSTLDPQLLIKKAVTSEVKDYVSDTIEKKRSRSIGYDVLEVVEGKRSFMTIYGSKIWDLFPAMSFLKILNFKTNLPNMKFDYTKLDEKIIFYAEL